MQLRGAVATLATMHQKERVIGPVLERLLGLRVVVARGLDTDRFGTFAGDVVRRGSPLLTARAKARAALELDAGVDLALASEGSFTANPVVPSGPLLGVELVVLLHRTLPFEVVGRHVAAAPSGGWVVRSSLQALDAAERLGFPGFGVIVTGARDGVRAPDAGVYKELRYCDDVLRAVEELVARDGAAWIETDGRAHRNPARMQAVGRAAEDLARRASVRCPSCEAPGFAVVAAADGLSCAWCDEPTASIKSETSACWRCGHRQTIERGAVAPAGECERCNP